MPIVQFETVYKVTPSIGDVSAVMNSAIALPPTAASARVGNSGSVKTGPLSGETQFIKYRTGVPFSGVALPDDPTLTITAAKLEYKVAANLGVSGFFRTAILIRNDPKEFWEDKDDAFDAPPHVTNEDYPRVTVSGLSDVVIAGTRHNETWLELSGDPEVSYTAANHPVDQVISLVDGYAAPSFGSVYDNLVSELQDYFTNTTWDALDDDLDYLGFALDPTRLLSIISNFFLYQDDDVTEDGVILTLTWTIDTVEGCVVAFPTGRPAVDGEMDGYRAVGAFPVLSPAVGGREKLERSIDATVGTRRAVGGTPLGGCQ